MTLMGIDKVLRNTKTLNYIQIYCYDDVKLKIKMSTKGF